MDFNNKWFQGVIGIVLLLCGFGGSQLIDVDVIDNSYVCSINEKVGVFEGNAKHPEPLSNTAKSGYWTNSLGESKLSQCRGGIWTPLKEYAKAKGINPETFTSNVNVEEETETVTCPICPVVNCGPQKECPKVNVLAYMPDGTKYWCTEPGFEQECERADDMMANI